MGKSSDRSLVVELRRCSPALSPPRRAPAWATSRSSDASVRNGLFSRRSWRTWSRGASSRACPRCMSITLPASYSGRSADHHVLLHLAEELRLVLQGPRARRGPIASPSTARRSRDRLQALATRRARQIIRPSAIMLFISVELVVQSILHGPPGHTASSPSFAARGVGDAGKRGRFSHANAAARSTQITRGARGEPTAKNGPRAPKRHPRRATETHLHHRILRHAARVLEAVAPEAQRCARPCRG